MRRLEERMMKNWSSLNTMQGVRSELEADVLSTLSRLDEGGCALPSDHEQTNLEQIGAPGALWLERCGWNCLSSAFLDLEQASEWVSL